MTISIIIPVYNVKEYLDRCFKSIINQTCSNFEVICIDDGSTDGSSDILDEYSKNYKFIKVFHQSNHGTGYSRNKGIEYSTGDYICFIDPDDYISNYYIQHLNRYIEKQYEIILFNIYIKHNDRIEYYNYADKVYQYSGVHIDQIGSFDYKILYPDKVLHLPKWCPSFCIKRSILLSKKVYFSDITISEDTIFSIKLLFLNKKVYYLNEYLYYYVKRNNSYSSCLNLFHKNDIFIMCNELINLFNDNKNFNSITHKNFYNYLVYRLARHYPRIPIDYRDEYNIKCKYILKSYFKYYLVRINENKTYLGKLFSITTTQYDGVACLHIFLFWKRYIIYRKYIPKFIITFFKAIKNIKNFK